MGSATGTAQDDPPFGMASLERLRDYALLHGREEQAAWLDAKIREQDFPRELARPRSASTFGRAYVRVASSTIGRSPSEWTWPEDPCPVDLPEGWEIETDENQAVHRLESLAMEREFLERIGENAAARKLVLVEGEIAFLNGNNTYRKDY